MSFNEYFKNRYPYLQPSDFEDFSVIANSKRLKRGEKLIDLGERKKEVMFVVKGIIRGYLINYNGKEITTAILQEYHAFGAYEPLILDQPTNHVYECLEDTELVVVKFSDLEELTRKNERIKKVIDTIVFDILVTTIRRTESFIIHSPESRYKNFVEENGDLLQRVSQKHIASYLGITPVSFSRLKKRIYEAQEEDEDSE